MGSLAHINLTVSKYSKYLFVARYELQYYQRSKDFIIDSWGYKLNNDSDTTIHRNCTSNCVILPSSNDIDMGRFTFQVRHEVALLVMSDGPTDKQTHHLIAKP